MSIICTLLSAADNVSHMMFRLFIFMLDAERVMRERCHHYAPLRSRGKDNIFPYYFIKA